MSTVLIALKALLADIEDYQRINNLGGENNRSQVMAREAIAEAEGRRIDSRPRCTCGRCVYADGKCYTCFQGRAR